MIVRMALAARDRRAAEIALSAEVMAASVAAAWSGDYKPIDAVYRAVGLEPPVRKRARKPTGKGAAGGEIGNLLQGLRNLGGGGGAHGRRALGPA